jgi:uncharacterized RDD family membrane protein YckC
MTTSSVAGLPATRPAYARFSRRFRALVTDGGIILVGVVAATMLTEVLADHAVATRALWIVVILGLVLYEPVLVACFGATLGHRWTNLRVVDDASGGNIGLLRAFARAWIKNILGLLSFVTMALTRRHQAIHDRLTHSTVQVRDLAKARAHQYNSAREVVVPAGVPAAGRRIVVILVYMALGFLAMSIVAARLVAPLCLAESRCSAGDDLVFQVDGLVWVAVSALIIIAGWKGRLFGGRARPGTTAVEPPPPN